MFSPKVTKNTLVDYPRLRTLKKLVEQAEHLSGDVAEVGVYRGGTAYLISSLSKKRVHLFDTFEGMPEVDSTKDLHHTGDFADTSLEQVMDLLSEMKGTNFYKGTFPRETSHYIENESFAFVHLDVDIYSSVKECLEFFYPRMVKGGVIVLDDYLEPNCPGAKLATDEFLAEKSERLELTTQSQAMFVKL